ncbi:murein biosynthesis integral membrane protein MurJ [Dokdonella sp. MW10]|uniref:murein biosynthesis integral membrane protein MurJ n=1 Tax=Dokdonella sp. MW10 TaxID=2992926 RepID=UPI003F823140
MKPSLLRSMLAFSSGTFVSRVLGLVREMVVAAVFGVSAATDAFLVAFRIPNFMRRLFAEGSFSMAFVPVLTEYREKRSAEELRELVARTAGTLGAVLLVVTALGVIFADVLVGGFAPGSLDEPGKFALTSDLLRLTFPFLLFVSLTALAGAALNTFNRFGLAALTPVVLNVCMIAAALWLAPHLEVPIMALGWAVLAAGVLQLAVQLPALHRLGLLAWPRWGAAHEGVRRVMKLMVPTLFGSSVAQVNLLLDTLIASFLIVGSQTWLGYTDRLLEFPLGMFGVALGTVILPTLSRHHVAADPAGFSRALDWGLRTTLLIGLPAMLGLVILAEPILATLFQHGKFTAHDVRMAAMSLAALSFGLPAFTLVKTLAPAFYSRQDTTTPVRAGIASMVASMLLNVVFVGALFALWSTPEQRAMGWREALASVPGLHVGLALSSACASYLNVALLWRALRRDGVYTREAGWGRHLVRLVLACAALAATLLVGVFIWDDWSAWSVTTRVWRLGVLIAAGGVAFAGVLFAFGFRLRDLRGPREQRA